jgi:hypothetical protein
MKPQPLRPLLEAVTATPGSKKFSGEVKSPDLLLSAEALTKLESMHSGLFAILVYMPQTDLAFAEYVKTNTLGGDTGQKLFLLFESTGKTRTLGAPAGLPITDVSSEPPLVDFARSLFPNQHLVLPGVVFVERLTHSRGVIYTPLHGFTDVQALIPRLRLVFGVMASLDVNDTPNARPFAQRAGISLAKKGVTYLSTDEISIQEYFIKAVRSLWDVRRDILALVPVVGKAFMGKESKGKESR